MLRENLIYGFECYRPAQWIVLFFIYGFLGWIWESTYMSLLEKRKQNRGFLSGPFIPIYGFGATIVLYVTMPYYDCWWRVMLMGMIVGTMMEEIAGRVMYLVFEERYWSYEGYPGNIDGFICIPATLLWGFFSIFTLYYLNRPFDYFVKHMPYPFLVAISLTGILFLFMDIKNTLKRELDIERLRIPVHGKLWRFSNHMDFHNLAVVRYQRNIIKNIRIGNLKKIGANNLNRWIRSTKKKNNKKNNHTFSKKKM